MLPCLRPLPSRRFSFCRFFCSAVPPHDTDRFAEAFARRMEMAGIKSHHRIALGISGGPDSMALCALTASWKSRGACGKSESSGFVDGLLGIIVDHRLRPESTEEANLVCSRVLKLGVQCRISSCDWSDGRPTRGQVQEAARELRYRIFHNVCYEHSIGVLLVAHHCDDQAELFVLRLSRHSGVLGLAGMAFVSQSFPSNCPSSNGLLIVRPLLSFSKNDMYEICLGTSQEWVEDPSNQKPIYVRNRIRMLLNNLSTDSFRSELQALIAHCRVTRAYVDRICLTLIQTCVSVTDYGYAIVALDELDPSNVDDLCLSKLLAGILQFISQRQTPVRGAVSKLLLDYTRKIPCKTSLSVAGCYLCPVPKSKGTKLMVAAEVDSPRPLDAEMPSYQGYFNRPSCPSSEIDEIVSDAKLFDFHLPDLPPFIKSTSPDSILKEAMKLNIISEPTYNIILSLQKEEAENFRASAGSKDDDKVKHRAKTAYIPLVELHPGDTCHFMKRFMITWEVHPDRTPSGSCMMENEGAFIRHMVDADWLYLAKLSKGEMAAHQCLDYGEKSAQIALQVLKSIPAPARRGLPVLINSQGLPLSIPSIQFSRCPGLTITARFEPRVPLGGGFSSFL